MSHIFESSNIIEFLFRSCIPLLFYFACVSFLRRNYSEKENISTEFFNKKDAIQLVNELCKLHDFTITDDYNVFDFSFPKIEFERYIFNKQS